MEIITHVAMIVKEKLYILPPPNRHHDLILLIHNQTGMFHVHGDQGFYTNKNRFVDRFEAKNIAEKANQIIHTRGLLNKLYSEDIW